MTDYPVVIVEWIDSHTLEGWRDIDEFRELVSKPGRLDMRSAGFLVHECKVSITVALSAGEKQLADAMTIPRCAIKSIRKLSNDQRRENRARPAAARG